MPQDERQKTSPTQPFPSNEPFVTHHVTDEQFDAIRKIAVASAKGKSIEVVNGKEIFTPPRHGTYAVVTRARRVEQLAAVVVQPEGDMFYVCA